MKGMMKFLVAANLVTLSEEEQREVQPELNEVLPPPHHEPAPVLTEYAESDDVIEGRSFDDIFASANLPISPYPAERLLRLLDGLREMDEPTRKAAVRAMDGADDSWTMADPVILTTYRLATAAGACLC